LTAWTGPGASQVAVFLPGSTRAMYLGAAGNVTGLTYSFAFPGGADQLTCNLAAPVTYRTQALNPGNTIVVYRGGHQVWSGQLGEPVPTTAGWAISGVGAGNLGTNFAAVYTGTWPSGIPDGPVNLAIGRGLPWSNPGIGSPAGMWLGQEVDPGAQTITDLMNLLCTRGGLAWYVNSQPGGIPGNDLSVFPLPTAVNRLLVSTTPVPRSLGGYLNSIWVRYCTSDDGTNPATFTTVLASNAASITRYGALEAYLDLSDVGVMSAGAAQGVGNSVLSNYQAISFAGPFTAAPGQLLNVGGQAIDPGTDQAGTVIRCILTDYAYGGSVLPQNPVTFPVGEYQWDEDNQVATITPYASLDQSLTGLLSMQSLVLTPISAA